MLRANASSPVDLARIQNEALRLSLEEVRTLLAAQHIELRKLTHLMQRWTAMLSPAKGYSNETYAHRGEYMIPCPVIHLRSSSAAVTALKPLASVTPTLHHKQATSLINDKVPHTLLPIHDHEENPFLAQDAADAMSISSTLPIIDPLIRELEDTGVYAAEDDTLHAFVCASPPSPGVPQTRTPVDLILPPLPAFHKEGQTFHLRCRDIVE